MVLLGVLYMYMVSTDYSSSSGRRKVKSINRRYKAEFLSELMQWNYNIKLLLIAPVHNNHILLHYRGG